MTKIKSGRRVLTCVYCGKEYPDGTPASQHELLSAHIKICEKHPLREAEQKISMLRSALVGLIGVETIDELNIMELTMRASEVPACDKSVCIDAIDALRKTL